MRIPLRTWLIMQSERWRQIEDLCQAALSLAPQKRSAFLTQACLNDPQLRAEVQSLLDQRADSFLESGPVPAIRTLNAGATLGNFEIVELLGRGGMGEVWRARDVRLKRDVAIKVLPADLARDPDRIARFEREARAASALNHPNIVSVYDIGRDSRAHWIVSELVRGDTLRRAIEAGPLPAPKVIEIAAQVAAGLTAAHAAGLVHRDLKPDNIMVTREGRVKILDFGLAKQRRPASDAATADPTDEGMVLGTAGYMSPEQVRGEPADHRSDLFSFGVVLHEMLSGKRAFSGGSSVEVMHAILKDDPPELPASVPPALALIVRRCLEKEPARRFQSVADLAFALQPSSLSLPPAAAPKRKIGLPRAWPFVAVAAILLAAALFYQVRKPAGLFRTSSPPARPTHRQITFVGDATYPAISPDGNFVAYVTGNLVQGQKLVLQDLKGGQTIDLTEAGRIWRPKWSPDGTELAVLRQNPPQKGIFLIPRLGGPPRFIAEGEHPSWSPDGRQIAVASEEEVGFRIVDKLTGSLRTVHLSGFSWQNDLDWSPASNLLAVLTSLANGTDVIWAVRPDGSQQRKVIEEEEGLASPRWTPTGDGIYVLHATQGETQDLLKVATNPKSGQAKGPPSVLLSGLQAGNYFTVSADGMRLAYSRSPRNSNLWLTQFQSPDNGKTLGQELQTRSLTKGTARYDMPSISPDGQWITFVTGGHIYKMAMEGGTPMQLTFSNGADVSPAWSPDGKRIAFGSHEGEVHKVWIMDADGANRRQFAKTRLAVDPDAQVIWSPGRNILYQKPLNRNYSILDPETGEERPLVQNESVGWLFVPKYSPDGKNVAVLWNRPPQGGIWVISLIDDSQTFLWKGSRFPAGWSSDGSSIYAYRGSDMLSIPAGAAGHASPRPALTVAGEFGGYTASVGLVCPGCVSVSPDGTKFAYSAGETKSDVWVVDNFDPANRK